VIDESTVPLLKVCADLGLLALRDLFVELAIVAGDRTFTASEVCAHAAVPVNRRLRAAIEANCGEVSPRKLGKILAKSEGLDVASLLVHCIGNDAAGILWRVSRLKPISTVTAANEDAIVSALSPQGGCAHGL
jgi:hypothetical protein